MFVADLSWKEPGVEKVGERRQRKAREQAATRATTPIAYPSSTTGPSFPPLGEEVDKASSKSVPLRNKLSSALMRPIRNRRKKSIDSDRPVFKIERVPTLLQRKGRTPEETPQLSPSPEACTSSNIQSAHKGFQGLGMARQEEFEGFCQAYDEVKNKIYALQSTGGEATATPPQRMSPVSLIQSSSLTETDYAESTTAGSECDAPEQIRYCSYNNAVVINHLSTEQIEEAPKPHHTATIEPCSTQADSPTSLYYSESRPCTPPSALSGAPLPNGLQIHRDSVATPRLISPMPQMHETREYSSTLFQASRTDEDHFIRLLRRMEAASAKVILDRMREDWQNSPDPVVHEELHLEKQLWAIVAVESPVLDPFLKHPANNYARRALISMRQHQHIVEIDGNLAELYYTASHHVGTQIVHLMMPNTTVEAQLSIPAAITQYRIENIFHPSTTLGYQHSALSEMKLSLPYTALSVDQLRASRLATIIPEPYLQAFMADCLRILRLGGSFELRVVDAIPDRGTTGPRLANWLKDNFMVNLERDQICSRPCHVLPQIAAQVGFKAMRSGSVDLIRHLKLPAAVPRTEANVASNIACITLRELWKDNWGRYIRYANTGTPKWWWDDRDIIEECLEWRTVWDVGTLLAMKDGIY